MSYSSVRESAALGGRHTAPTEKFYFETSDHPLSLTAVSCKHFFFLIASELFIVLLQLLSRAIDQLRFQKKPLRNKFNQTSAGYFLCCPCHLHLEPEVAAVIVLDLPMLSDEVVVTVISSM